MAVQCAWLLPWKFFLVLPKFIYISNSVVAPTTEPAIPFLKLRSLGRQIPGPYAFPDCVFGLPDDKLTILLPVRDSGRATKKKGCVTSSHIGHTKDYRLTSNYHTCSPHTIGVVTSIMDSQSTTLTACSLATTMRAIIEVAQGIEDSLDKVRLNLTPLSSSSSWPRCSIILGYSEHGKITKAGVGCSKDCAPNGDVLQ